MWISLFLQAHWRTILKAILKIISQQVRAPICFNVLIALLSLLFTLHVFSGFHDITWLLYPPPPPPQLRCLFILLVLCKLLRRMYSSCFTHDVKVISSSPERDVNLGPLRMPHDLTIEYMSLRPLGHHSQINLLFVYTPKNSKHQF